MEPPAQTQCNSRAVRFVRSAGSDVSVPLGSHVPAEDAEWIHQNPRIFEEERNLVSFPASDDSHPSLDFLNPLIEEEPAIDSDINKQQSRTSDDQPYYTPLTNCDMGYEGTEQELPKDFDESDGDIGSPENSFQETETTEEAHYGLESASRTPTPPKELVDELEKPTTTNFGVPHHKHIASRLSGNWKPKMCYDREIKQEKNDCEGEQETDSSVTRVSKMGDPVQDENPPRSKNRGVKRRGYKITPSEEKTAEYFVKREKNNVSVKQSRDKKKKLEEEKEEKLRQLEARNKELVDRLSEANQRIATLEGQKSELLKSNKETVEENKRLRIKNERLKGHPRSQPNFRVAVFGGSLG